MFLGTIGKVAPLLRIIERTPHQVGRQLHATRARLAPYHLRPLYAKCQKKGETDLRNI